MHITEVIDCFRPRFEISRRLKATCYALATRVKIGVRLIQGFLEIHRMASLTGLKSGCVLYTRCVLYKGIYGMYNTINYKKNESDLMTVAYAKALAITRPQ